MGAGNGPSSHTCPADPCGSVLDHSIMIAVAAIVVVVVVVVFDVVVVVVVVVIVVVVVVCVVNFVVGFCCHC